MDRSPLAWGGNGRCPARGTGSAAHGVRGRRLGALLPGAASGLDGVGVHAWSAPAAPTPFLTRPPRRTTDGPPASPRRLSRPRRPTPAAVGRSRPSPGSGPRTHTGAARDLRGVEMKVAQAAELDQAHRQRREVDRERARYDGRVLTRNLRVQKLVQTIAETSSRMSAIESSRAPPATPGRGDAPGTRRGSRSYRPAPAPTRPVGRGRATPATR